MNKISKFGMALDVFEKTVATNLSLAVDCVGKKLCASLTASSTDPGFHHILMWLESLGFSTTTNHVNYTSNNRETSPADGIYFLRWNTKILMLTISSLDPTVFGAINKKISIKILGGNREDVNEILEEIKQLKENVNKDFISIYTYDGWWRLSGKKAPRPIKTLFYADNILEDLTQDCLSFFEKQEEYRNKGIPWRRGYILYGEPGNGKTSLVFGIASQLKLPIYVVNLTHADSLGKMLIDIDEKCLILIEEIDTFTVSRADENTPIPTTENPTLTTHKVFGDFLNSLDGLTSKEGIVLFATTNHKDKLDAALIRPGRFDKHVEIKNCTSELAKEMFLLHFPKKSPTEFATLFKNNDLSVSYAQELLLEMSVTGNIPNELK